MYLKNFCLFFVYLFVCLFVCLYSEHFYHMSHLEDADTAAGVLALPLPDPNCLVLFSLAAQKRFRV